MSQGPDLSAHVRTAAAADPPFMARGAGNLTGVHPHVGGEIGMRVVDSGVDVGNDDGWPFLAGGTNEYSTVDAEILRAIAALDNTPSGSSVLVMPAQLSTVTFSEVSISGATRVVAKPGAADGQVPKRLTLVEGLS